MNTPFTFVLGWTSFAAGVLGGGFLGYRQFLDESKQRRIENIEHVRIRNEILDKREAEMRASGSRLFRKRPTATPDSNATVSAPPDISKDETAIIRKLTKDELDTLKKEDAEKCTAADNVGTIIVAAVCGCDEQEEVGSQESTVKTTN